MKRFFTTTASSAVALAIGATLPAMAQDGRDSQIAALTARVAELETRAERPPLSFGANDTSFEIYGYIKADLIYDFDYDLGNTIFGLGAVNADSLEDPNFQAIAWETRLGLRTTTPTSMGDIETQIETDFYGGDGGGELRLRHAVVRWNGWQAGRYWTRFMPLNAYPGTIDFQGPAGIPFARQTQFGYLHDFGNGFSLGGYIENPTYDSDMPAFVGVAEYEADSYFVRGTLLGGQIDQVTVGNDVEVDDTDVWGYNLSGTADLWENTSMNATFTQGEAIASYMVFSNDGFDFYNVNDAGDAIETTAGTIGIVQGIGDLFEVKAAYGYRKDDNPNPGATSKLQTLHLTGNYFPADNVAIGMEYILGEREVAGGDTFDADRLQAAVQVDF